MYRFWILVTFGGEVTKIQEYYVIFVYILHGKMGKTVKTRKEKHATKVTKIPKTKRWKNGMKKHKSHKLATLSALSTLLTVIFWANLMTPVLDKTHVCGYNYLLIIYYNAPEILPFIYDTIYKFTSIKIEEIFSFSQYGI